MSGPSVVSDQIRQTPPGLDHIFAFVVSPNMQAARPTTAEHGSRTIVVTDAQPREDPHADPTSPPTRMPPQGGVLRLRGGPRNTQRVVWREDVVDNEGCGKKSSKSMLPPSFGTHFLFPSTLHRAHKVLIYIHPLSSLLHIPQTPRI